LMVTTTICWPRVAGGLGCEQTPSSRERERSEGWAKPVLVPATQSRSPLPADCFGSVNQQMWGRQTRTKEGEEEGAQ